MMLNDNNSLDLSDVGRLPRGMAAWWRSRFGTNAQRVPCGIAIFAANCALTPAMGRKLLAFWGALCGRFFNIPSARHQPLSGNLRASRSSCTGSSRECRTSGRCRTCSLQV